VTRTASRPILPGVNPRSPRTPSHRARSLPSLALAAVALGSAACSGGTDSTSVPIETIDVEPELVFCRAYIGREHNDTEILVRNAQGLGDGRIPARGGAETGARVSPDGTLVAFARQRRSNEPESTEIYVAQVDNSAPQQRLTVNAWLDDAPTWSPDGSTLLVSSLASGERRLWLVPYTASNLTPREFLASTTADTDPDWHAGSDRIVFSRFDTARGRWGLVLVNGDGTGVMPLTDGGALAGPEAGDREPAWDPAGDRIAFSRVAPGGDSAALMEIDLGTLTVREILAGGDRAVRRPRCSPNGDQILVTVDDAGAGRPGARLSRVLPDGTGLALLLPDERFAAPGFDPLPTFPALPAANPPELLLFDGDDVVIEGLPGFARVEFLREEDQTPFIIATTTINGRELAGLNVVTPIPEDVEPADVLGFRVRVVASVRRFGGDSQVRVTLRNHVERRFDTVVERTPTNTDAAVFEFATTSLAHVDRNGFISAAVIAEIEPGDRTELWVDQFEIEVTTRERAP